MAYVTRATKPSQDIRAHSTEELYADTGLYRSSQDLLPPSEKLPHVLRLELTQGCSWGRCNYCHSFDRLPYAAKTPEAFEQHVAMVMERVGHRTCFARRFERLFIGGGNALSLETPRLLEALALAVKSFKTCTGSRPRRTALYGTTRDILMHGKEGLDQLWNENAGLDLIYWGVESGSDEILKAVRKGDTKKKLLTAAKLMRTSTIDTSVMIMPGLGGARFSESHVKETAKVLSAINPKFITFLGVHAPGTKYAAWMRSEEAEGLNRPLTPRETAEQTIAIISAMRPEYPVKIGCFGNDIDKVANNPLPFNSAELDDACEKREVVDSLRRLLKQRFG